MAKNIVHQNAKGNILLLGDEAPEDKRIIELFNRLPEKEERAFIYYASCSLKEKSTLSFARETPAGAGQ